MTDEARIKRLTELARRVWPDAAAAVVDGVPSVHEMTDYYGEYIHIARHPRALDALEAALLVLSGDLVLTGDERNLMRPDIRRVIEANVEVGMAYTKLLVDVEQLAGEWDRSGDPAIKVCAAELRERARKP